MTASSATSCRALIVDDEALARTGLRAMLAGERAVTVVGEASTGAEAAIAIRSLDPDVLFLDVRMPDLDGFGLLSSITGRTRPLVVFVTAHDDHAVRAFGIDAVDYLLKPFGPARVSEAVGRVLRRLRSDAGDGAAGQEPGRFVAGSNRRLLVRRGGEARFVELEEVAWIEVLGNYLRVAVDGRFHLMRQTLAALLDDVGSPELVRVSRSVVVNLRHLQRVRRLPDGRFELILRGGTALRSSRRYQSGVKEALEGHAVGG